MKKSIIVCILSICILATLSCNVGGMSFFATMTPTPTNTSTPTFTPTVTLTFTPTSTPTDTPTLTPTATATASPTPIALADVVLANEDLGEYADDFPMYLDTTSMMDAIKNKDVLEQKFSSHAMADGRKQLLVGIQQYAKESTATQWYLSMTSNLKKGSQSLKYTSQILPKNSIFAVGSTIYFLGTYHKYMIHVMFIDIDAKKVDLAKTGMVVFIAEQAYAKISKIFPEGTAFSGNFGGVFQP